MIVTVLSPGIEVFKGEARSVKVPGTHGQFEILNNHAPIVSSLEAGEIRIIDAQGNKKRFHIASGFVEVLNNEVAVLVQGVKEEA